MTDIVSLIDNNGWVEYDSADTETWPPDGHYINMVRGSKGQTDDALAEPDVWIKLYGKVRHVEGQEPMIDDAMIVGEEMHWPWPVPPLEPTKLNADTIFWRCDR